jgi:hypothetical protein
VKRSRATAARGKTAGGTAAKADAAKRNGGVSAREGTSAGAPKRARATNAGARKATTAKPARAQTGAKRSSTSKAAGTKRRATSAPRAAREQVPRQGYAAEGERVSGPVPPPGGVELFATAAEIVSELAKAGVSAGERLIRDAVSRLPFS